MNRLLAVTVAALAALATPAGAQYQPAPGYGQPAYGQPAYASPDLTPLRPNTVRVSGGVAFVGAGYYCSYYGYYPGYYGTSCGAGYSTTQPNINLDFDLGLGGPSAVTLGGNVFWGSYNRIDTTIWEPHVDYLYRSGTSRDPIVGRFRIGVGMYIASASGTSNAGTGYSDTKVGGALRLGGGVSLLNDGVVGIGLDAIFEAGSIGGYYVSTIQLLAGPELHF